MRRPPLLLGTAVVLAVAAAGPASAQLKSRPADEWTKSLERPERIAGLKIPYIIASLGLKAGDTVADIGAGPGVISLPLAKAVAPGGTVYAEEVDQGFLDHIKQRASDAGVTNVTTVLGEYTDPKLPAKVDVVLFHDVLHHIKDRATFLRNTAPYVKPGGRIAIVDLPPTGSHKDEPDLIVTKEQVKGWMADAGFKPVAEFNGLEPDKWFVVYARQ